jgi:NADPH:quinone reductase-like Zn-dependent oxidoreductase
LAPTGVYVSSVGRLGWVLRVAVASLSARGRGKIVSLTGRQTQQDLAFLKEMLESGKVKPVIDRRYTLAEAPEALRYQGQGRAQGRIVITV